MANLGNTLINGNIRITGESILNTANIPELSSDNIITKTINISNAGYEHAITFSEGKSSRIYETNDSENWLAFNTTGKIIQISTGDGTDYINASFANFPKSSTSNVASESWVKGLGYLTQSSLNGYATQTWTSANYFPLAGGTLNGAINFNVDTAAIMHDGGLPGSLKFRSAARTITVEDGSVGSSSWSHVIFSQNSFPYASNRNIASEEWVTSQNYLTDATLNARLDPYALKTYVQTSLNGYATQTWVEDKNYATESYVTSRGYITSSSLSGYTPLTEAGLYNLISKSSTTTTPASYSSYYIPFVSSTSNTYRCTLSNLRTWFRSGLLSSVPSNYITETELSSELSSYALKSEIPDTSSFLTSSDLADYVTTSQLNNYVLDNKSGLYNLISNADITSSPSSYNSYYVPFVSSSSLSRRATLTNLKTYFTDGCATIGDLNNYITDNLAGLYNLVSNASTTTTPASYSTYYIPMVSSTSSSRRATLSKIKDYINSNFSPGECNITITNMYIVNAAFTLPANASVGYNNYFSVTCPSSVYNSGSGSWRNFAFMASGNGMQYIY